MSHPFSQNYCPIQMKKMYIIYYATYLRVIYHNMHVVPGLQTSGFVNRLNMFERDVLWIMHTCFPVF